MAGGILAQIASTNGMDWSVRTAGLMHHPGRRVAECAVTVLAELGIDISGEFSKPVDTEILDWADVVVPMTTSQAHFLTEDFPHVRAKLRLLGGDVDDPYLRPIESYREVRAVLEALLLDLFQTMNRESATSNELHRNVE